MSKEMPLTSRCTTLGFWPLGTKNVHGLLLWLCVGCHLLEMKKIQWFFSIPISCISSRIGGWRKQDVDFVGFDGCVGICFGFFASEWDRATGGDWTCGTGTSQEQNGLHPSQSRLCCFRGPFRIQYEQWVEKRIAKIGASQTDQPIIRSQLLEITLIGTPNPFPLHLQSPILLNSKPWIIFSQFQD